MLNGGLHLYESYYDKGYGNCGAEAVLTYQLHTFGAEITKTGIGCQPCLEPFMCGWQWEIQVAWTIPFMPVLTRAPTTHQQLALAGYHVMVIQGFSPSQHLADVQAAAEQCCLDISGVCFVMATYRRDDVSQGLSPIAILSLRVDAMWALRARCPPRDLLCSKTGRVLECTDLSLPQAG